MSSAPIATYSFLPWLRQGIANMITSQDHDASVKLRATVPVSLELSGDALTGPALTQPIDKQIQLYGPGENKIFDVRQIARVEPRNWITNFESNFLPLVEFYTEDYPWLYTPAAPDPTRMRVRPWITLAVLRKDEKADEFDEGPQQSDTRPFASIKLKAPAATVFPPADQLWAWAHVHVNRPLANDILSTDLNTVLPALQAVLNENPDLAYSRLLCPRKLDANAAYHAFIIPTFESGRLRGLGYKDFADLPSATHSAWATYPNRKEPDIYPVYFRWFFRTGDIGDFEYLVRLLKPKPVDKRVGTRSMDVQRPGSNLPGITNPELNGALKLGGALRVPLDSMTADDRAEVAKYDAWDQPHPHPFQKALASLINLADDYATQTPADANAASGLEPSVANSPDPVITPPLYSRWHSLTARLLKERDGSDIVLNDNWVHELNLDPRWRVPAGFGTRIVEDNQEQYMNAAWQQVGDVLAANRLIRWAQFARETSFILHDRHLTPLMKAQNEKFFQIAAPLQKRVMAQGVTVYQQVRTSHVQPAPASAAFRRIARPRARPVAALGFPKGKASPATAASVVSRINAGEITAAPPKTVPPGALTVNQVVKRFQGAGDAAAEENQTPQNVDRLPKYPDFRLTTPTRDTHPPTRGTTDSADSIRFKDALKDLDALLLASQKTGAPPSRIRLDLAGLTQTTLDALHPDLTVLKYVMQNIQLPARFADVLAGELREVMAYPVIDIPMYKPLTDKNPELFLPNINLIEQNSITLLEANQRFIESYMVGLNHEFSRELLWREYPTDMMGSYFRQFWDPSSMLDTSTTDKEALKEKLRDIPPLHKWPKGSRLGEHDNRRQPGSPAADLVLVIRGELLKKYPTAVIYAQKARWQLKPDGTVDRAQERRLVELTDAELQKPPRDKLKTPLYKSQVAPDIYFFGFDLGAIEARGDTGDYPDVNKPGWFFVIKERPGDPRFGLDVNRDGPLNDWNDLAWSDAAPGIASGAFLQIKNDTPTLTLTEPTTPDVSEKHDQWLDDRSVSWSKDASAADLAYILYRVPVLIAAHASEMLPR